MDITTRTADLSALSSERGGSKRLGAYVAQPTDRGPWPGVVMVMEIFGVNDDMRAHAERIARWDTSSSFRISTPTAAPDAAWPPR